MPSKVRRQYLQDMLEGIADIEEFLGAETLEEYVQDKLVKAAVERKILVIAEAAYRLGDQAEALIPMHDWIGLRGMGQYPAASIRPLAG